MFLPLARLVRFAPIPLVIALVLLLAAGTATRASAAKVDPTPELLLPASWYEVVEPYRYVEARRFERGWTRGAGVRTRGGAVRSPVTGRVRFSGHVAGRRVTTIESMLGRQRVVVTFTGADTIALAQGQQVRAGQLVGTGDRVHIGAYDPARRSRYLPVRVRSAAGIVADPSPPTAPSAAAPLPQDHSPLAERISERLLDAINGTATFADLPGSGHGRPMSGFAPAPRTSPVSAGARADRLVRPSRGRGATPWLGRALTQLRAQHHAANAEPRRKAAHATGGALVIPTFPARRQSASGTDLQAASSITGAGSRRRDASTPAIALKAASPQGVQTARGAAGANRIDAGEAMSSPMSGPIRPVASGAAVGSAAVQAGAVSETAVHAGSVRTDAESVEHPDASMTVPELRPVDERRWLLGVVSGIVLVLLLAIATRVKRRRRTARSRIGPTKLALPLPILVPHVRPYAYPVVHTDGSSILPDVGLAWREPEPGTSIETITPPRADARAPEPA
ncbi:MAG: hypothetical protein ABI200_05400 [Gaiellales bacterium]